MASPAFAGRLTGHAGYTAAAHWAADLYRLGAEADRGKDGYLQPYASPYTVVRSAAMTLFLPDGPDPASPGRQEMKLAPNTDFLPLLFTDSGTGRGRPAFVGWGISAPELGYDDYAGIDVKGRLVLCFRGAPPSTIPADQSRRAPDPDEDRPGQRRRSA